MLPYWIFFVIFAVGALLSRPYGVSAVGGPSEAPHVQGDARSRTEPLLVLCAALTAIMIGFRYEVGADWIPYEIIFENISYVSLRTALTYSDPAYGFLNWVANGIGARIWLVNLVCGAIFCFGLVRFSSWQPNPWLTILIAIPYLVIGVGMGYSRQAVAIGLAMCALTSIRHGSFLKFIMWMLVAAMFHRTAILLVPIIMLSYARNRTQALLLGGITLLFSYYYLILPGLEKFERGYVDQVYEAQGAGIRLAMNVVPALIFLAFQKHFNLPRTQMITWRNISLAALAAFGAYFAVASSVIVDRLALYLIPIQLFVFSRLPYLDRSGAVSLPLLIAVAGYSAAVQFVWLNYANHAEYWLPYQVYPVFDEYVPPARED